MQPVISFETSALLQTQGRAAAQLRAVRQYYARRYAASFVLPTVAAGGLLWQVAHHWPLIPPLAIVLGVVALLGVSGWLARPLRRLDAGAIARQLDRHYPELEDSAGLLLQNPAALPLLGRLQYQRIAQRLDELLAAGPALLPFSLTRAGLLTAGLLLPAVGLSLLPPAR
ncbi:MAG: hypothetical protein EOO59_01045, partial [Hymenobacter sp.]